MGERGSWGTGFLPIRHLRVETRFIASTTVVGLGDAEIRRPAYAEATAGRDQEMGTGCRLDNNYCRVAIIASTTVVGLGDAEIRRPAYTEATAGRDQENWGMGFLPIRHLRVVT